MILAWESSPENAEAARRAGRPHPSYLVSGLTKLPPKAHVVHPIVSSAPDQMVQCQTRMLG